MLQQPGWCLSHHYCDSLRPQTVHGTELCLRSIPVIGSQSGDPAWEDPIKATLTDH